MTKLSTIGRALAVLFLALTTSSRAFAQDEVTVSSEVSADRVPAGSNVVIAIILDHQPGWHSWPSVDQDVLDPSLASFAIRTNIAIAELPPQIESIYPIQWPEPHLSAVPNFDPDGPPTVDAPTYSDRAIAYLPIKLAEDATGTFVVPIVVSYQTCNEDICLMPVDVELEVSITVGESTGDRLAAADFQGFNADAFGQAPVDPKDLSDGSSDEAADESAAGIIILILLSALGGLVLNLTPCVLPIIPLKIMAMSAHADSPGKGMYLALWMAAGVVAFWGALGLPVAIFAGVFDPSRLFGIWWFTLAIGIIIGVMAVGIMGAFTINLPQTAYMFNPKADSATGSFLFGIMTAVLGLPCFGFVAGALLVGVATLPSFVIITIFTALGAGMASPYLVLAAKPKWIEKIPRTGPASEVVKQIMGLLLIAASVYFIGAGVLAIIGGNPVWLVGLPWWGNQVHVWLIGLAGLAAGGWLTLRTFQITKSAPRRAIFSLVALIISGAAVAYAADSTEKAFNNIWIPFSQEALDIAVADGKVVVVDFTAEWCITCKVVEARVLSPDPVHSKLNEPHVIPLVADLTSTKAAGWDKLTELGRTGIPYLAIFAGDADKPIWEANRYTAAQVMAAIKRGEEILGITAENTAVADSDGP